MKPYEIKYQIPAPYTSDKIEVLHLVNMAAYEWRLMDHDGKIVKASADNYGNAEIALSDALNWYRDYEAPPLY